MKTPKPSRTRLLAAIEHAGSNQSELARKLDVSVTTVHRWCSGASALSASRWIAVATVLGLPVDWTAPKKGGA